MLQEEVAELPPMTRSITQEERDLSSALEISATMTHRRVPDPPSAPATPPPVSSVAVPAGPYGSAFDWFGKPIEAPTGSETIRAWSMSPGIGTPSSVLRSGIKEEDPPPPVPADDIPIPSFSHHTGLSWVPFSEEHCAQIVRAMRASPDGGAVELSSICHEVRWGTNASSDQMPSAPASGIIMVSTESGHTRIVQQDEEEPPPPELDADSSLPPPPPPWFSHLTPAGTWEPYPRELCDLIGAAQQAASVGGHLHLPGIPFEIRWGDEARSESMPDAPESGMVQVHLESGATRLVRQDAGESGGVPLAPPPPPPM